MAYELVTADTQTTDTGGAYAIVDGGTYSAIAQQFVPTTSYTVHSIALSLVKTGSPPGNIQVSIRADSGGDPGSSITNGDSVTIAASSISSPTAFYTFTFATPPSLTASTTYHIELTHSGGVFDGSNTISWSRAGSNAYAAGVLEIKVGAGAWTDDGSSDDFAWKMYKFVADEAGFFYISV